MGENNYKCSKNRRFIPSYVPEQSIRMSTDKNAPPLLLTYKNPAVFSLKQRKDCGEIYTARLETQKEIVGRALLKKRQLFKYGLSFCAVDPWRNLY